MALQRELCNSSKNFQLSPESKIAIIGAGPAGLCAAATLLKKGYSSITVYEQSNGIGGTWRFNEKPTDRETSSMYHNLKTNVPKESMGFLDYPFPKGEPSFPGHKEVLQYLTDYATHNDVMKLILFSRKVEKISKNVKQSSEPGTWAITDSVECTGIFDFVIFANGHYSKQSIPDIFRDSCYKGEIMHSHNYRIPETFNGKNVLVIGTGQSGTDISIDVSRHASSVSLLGKTVVPALPGTVKQYIAWVDQVIHDGVITTDNEKIECDAIILCTGYKYDFSFAEEYVKLHPSGRKVCNLYRQILPIENPTIAILCVPSFVLPFPLLTVQTEWIIAVWTNSHKLPSVDVMKTEAEKTPGIGCPLIPRQFHKMGPTMLPYMKQMLGEACLDFELQYLLTLFTHTFCIRSRVGPVAYRDVEYKLENGSVMVKLPGAERYTLYEPSEERMSCDISC